MSMRKTTFFVFFNQGKGAINMAREPWLSSAKSIRKELKMSGEVKSGKQDLWLRIAIGILFLVVIYIFVRGVF